MHSQVTKVIVKDFLGGLGGPVKSSSKSLAKTPCFQCRGLQVRSLVKEDPACYLVWPKKNTNKNNSESKKKISHVTLKKKKNL